MVVLVVQVVVLVPLRNLAFPQTLVQVVLEMTQALVLLKVQMVVMEHLTRQAEL
jgi:hypothetical protein